MKPTQFAYDRPETVDEALELLDEHHDAELLAGNQSLGIIMANRFASPERLVDINRLDGLAFVDISDDEIEIGAMTRHRTLERHDDLRSVLELVPESAEQIAGPAVRNRGTMGGSIAEADPAGNYPAVLAALGGELHVASVDGERTIPADDYFVGYMFTDLEEHELITSVSFPREPFPQERTGSAFVELKRGSQTWPTVSAATAVRVDDPSRETPLVEESRLAVGNAAGIPLRIDDALAELAGEPLSEDALDSVAEAVREAADPTDEMHADREYKSEMAGEYAIRSLRKSYERACGN
ncbi:xanthine dehydrogenase family protein subunit M [Salinigranum marinum]|uniref:FAD binding domain-containing protein n=1 Tax=Salinigranum marinum TaxID=1515595 RepID=UPI002989F647|nr:xanthine dehydrogenase family protein subunit M [Salinigranum marinum]